jgi:3-hydroxybutyryl-CoA dehydratase
MSGKASPVVRVLTQARIQAYADASGDHNPIHVDEEFARTTPFEGTIAHGMLVLALIGEVMFGAAGERWLTSGKLKVRFKAPTRPGDIVTASATPTKESNGVTEYDVSCVNQKGETVIEGRATVGAA